MIYTTRMTTTFHLCTQIHGKWMRMEMENLFILRFSLSYVYICLFTLYFFSYLFLYEIYKIFYFFSVIFFILLIKSSRYTLIWWNLSSVLYSFLLFFSCYIIRFLFLIVVVAEICNEIKKENKNIKKNWNQFIFPSEGERLFERPTQFYLFSFVYRRRSMHQVVNIIDVKCWGSWWDDVKMVYFFFVTMDLFF